MSKVVESLVCVQVTAFLPAYRKHHSTETAVLKIVLDILQTANNGKVTLLGLLDMSAAFDTVDHDILLDRLNKSFGISGTVLSWVESFVTGGTQAVHVGEDQSTTSAVVGGVPQGRVLGLLLFLLYTADVLKIIQQNGLSGQSYADDTSIYLHTDASQCTVQIKYIMVGIDDINKWITSNSLKLNTDKTQFIWPGTAAQLTKINTRTIT